MSANDSDTATDAPTLTDADLTDLLAEAEARLDSLSAGDCENLSDEQIASLRSAVKGVEDTAEDARKDAVEEEMDTRVDAGESLAGVTRVESHNKYVTGDETSVIMSAVSRGIDPSLFTEVNASDLAAVSEDEDVDADFSDDIGRFTYTYYRG